MPLPRAKQVLPPKPKRVRGKKWLQLEAKVDALPGIWCYGELLNLEGWKTIKYKELEHHTVVLAEVTTQCPRECKCLPSESEIKKSGFTEPYHVLDLLVRSRCVHVHYRLQRMFCKRCRTGTQQPLPGVDDKHSMTARLVSYVEEESFDLFRSFSGVADEVGCSEQTVRNIFTRCGERLDEEAAEFRRSESYEPPVWLAIDEVYPRKREEKYHVVSAPLDYEVLDILEAKGSDDDKGRWQISELDRWLVNLRPKHDRVKAVSMDMWDGFRSLVKKRLPCAKIVVDRYHVHNLLNVALKQVLVVLRASMTYSEHRALMRDEHLVLASYRKLVDEHEKEKENEGEGGVKIPTRKELVDTWLAQVPDLKLAHGLKEGISDILHLTDRGQAEGRLDVWLEEVHNFAEHFRAKYMKKHPGPWPDPFGNVAGTVRSWRDSILNYIDFKSMFDSRPVSNSFAEFVNARIKLAYRVGHHYSMEVLRLKCVHGGVMVRRRPPYPLDPPRLRAVRSHRPGKKKGKKTNPDSNLGRLRRARLDADETRGLLLPRPDEHPGWAERFNREEIEKAGRANIALALEAEAAAEVAAAEAATQIGREEREMPPVEAADVAADEVATDVNQEEKEAQPTENKATKRRHRYDPDQRRLF